MRSHQDKRGGLSQAQPQARGGTIHSGMVSTLEQLTAI